MLEQGLLLLQAEPAAPAETGSMSGWIILAIILAVFIVPFGIGRLIASALKMNDYATKLGLVLFAVTLSVTPFIFEQFATGDWRNAIRLGIDLAGGTNLVYEVDEAKAESEFEKQVTTQLMDKMVGSIARRVNPSGTEEVTVRRVGAKRIEVIIPGADRLLVEEKKRLITKLGSLEFGILANNRDHADIIAEANKLLPSERDYRIGGRIRASWRSAGRDQQGEYKDVSAYGDVATRTVTLTDEEGNPEEVQQFLVIIDPEDRKVTGKYLTNASPILDNQTGQLAVSFTLNTAGGYRFGQLTGSNLPGKDQFQRRLAILLDGAIHSAPGIESTINGQGRITGGFTRAEVDELVAVLNAGALDVPLKTDPISENTISPLLGADVQEKGIWAIGIALVVVFIFMAVYYVVAGLVADLCLLLNLVLVMGAMAFIDATFTLPGLAGLVLTIGMAVDANVLIFERIREERQRGASLRMSIQNGFDKALSTIVDANVTTLITAVILYMIGTDQVRGFAVTLFIGIVMSMFSALYFGHMVFDILERKRLIRDLKMLSVVGSTHINFLGKLLPAVALSLVLIGIGMGSLFVRGSENLDIDFTGGTMVSFEFEEAQQIDDVRKILEEEFGSGMSLERLTLTGELQDNSAGGRRYRLRTTETDTRVVREKLNRTFADSEHELRRVEMTYGDITQITGEAPAVTDTESTDTTAAAASDTDPFVGGAEVVMQFTGGISPTTGRDYLTDAISGIAAGDVAKYDNPAGLLEVEGVGETLSQGVAGTPLYDQIRVRTMSDLEQGDLRTALAAMQARMAEEPLYDEVNTFDGAVAGETQQNALLAIIVSMIAIAGYLWVRFQRLSFGLAAIVALSHDVLIVLGSVAVAAYLSKTPFGAIFDLYDFKINLAMIAAFLTIIGYSLNDTIVIFDRIREIRGKNPQLTPEMVNLSVNQTLARTLLTSLTTLLVVVILYAIGGEGIHGFAFCLIVGVITGTYSTIFIANPVLLWLMNRQPARHGAA